MSLTSTVDDAREVMQDVHYDLLLVDFDLPQHGGVRLCAEVRRAMKDVVIIFLHHGDHVKRHVLVFEIGADDSMLLPCDGEELVARATARRRQRRESVSLISPWITRTL